MKIEYIIETIKVAIAEVEWNYPFDYTLAFEETIKLLEKQIPKKPFSKVNTKTDWRFICPNCGEEWNNFKYNYCPNCGQRIEYWNNEGE